MKPLLVEARTYSDSLKKNKLTVRQVHGVIGVRSLLETEAAFSSPKILGKTFEEYVTSMVYH